ncbi:hypothetical protein, conserved [Trypanosoma brucei gambiense DAL972]|uniref:Xrn1 N-terminal domain-containing protein n=1 Tax=Trypanosoma brucei gambiense (strain MHOM/CI/86/DAL972) TaxID=679716 RepID=D0A5U8_TRYB9|nr:hypothetical protein, conserved [Trypanosoma brucei gambiense DAL972]CBH17049.1 hypothetical protein, conserved [Trypanosoma brucei gambiense DAL972]|eukprot:XP_011779313.1 hypothetical protein, conserved [Trypanosoma brucei gambiense DAL972]
MGTKGLRNYVEKHGLVRSSSRGRDGVIKRTNHLLLDMNAIVHYIVPTNVFTTKSVIEGVVEAVRKLISAFPPSETLVILFDGVAPCAKLQTQKTRRASYNKRHSSECTSSLELRYNHDYIGQEISFSREEIIAGSEFLLACEDAVRCAFGIGGEFCVPPGEGRNYTIIMSGCAEGGEGELKVVCVLRTIWLEQRKSQTYTGDDEIIVVGNDSDLVLVGVACTPYTKFTIVDPRDYVLTDVGELFKHWGSSSPGNQIRPDLLPSYRIDFVFLMLLSGGDWFEGIGKVALVFWRRYRELRLHCGYFKRSLIRGEGFDVDIEFLRAVMAVKDVSSPAKYMSKIKQMTMKESPLSREAIEEGVELLKGAVWALRSIVAGQCYDYKFRAHTKKPTAGMLKGASHVKGLLGKIRPVSESPLPCFSPLEQCIAVLGLRGRFSSPIHMVIKEGSVNQGEKLTNSFSSEFLLDETRRLMSQVKVDELTAAEQDLLQVRHMRFLESEDGKITFMSFHPEKQAVADVRVCDGGVK